MNPRMPRIRVAAIVIRDERMLFVRHRKGNRAYWMLPGGGLEFGETFARAAAREVLEETGLRVEVGPMLFISEAIEPRGHRHMVNIYMLAHDRGGDLVTPVGDIIDQVAFIPISEIPQITLFPAIGEALVAAHRDGFQGPVRHLPTRWID